jgi:DNA-binding MarR family transcriptional regulator
LPTQRRSVRLPSSKVKPARRNSGTAANASPRFSPVRDQQFVLTDQLEAPFDLYRHLPFRLATLTNLLALDRDMDIRRASDLGLRELRVLLNIGSYMPIRAADVAYQTRLDTFTVSRAVKSLLELGLIELQPDARDRRTHCLALTATGRQEYRRVAAVLGARDRALERILTAAERRQLEALLGRLEEFAEATLAEHAAQMLEQGERISADQRELIRWRKRSAPGR